MIQNVGGLDKQGGRVTTEREQKELRKLSRGDVDRRGSTSEPMDICFGRLQATSEGTGLGQGQDISVVLTKVDKGFNKVKTRFEARELWRGTININNQRR